MSADELADVLRFLDWLYEEGPELGDVPREWVIAAYRAWREEQASCSP